MEKDDYILLDERGTALAAAGLCCTLPDQARFAEMVRLGGRFNGKQIIPEAAIADIRKGGKPSDFVGSGYVLPEGYSYRDMWWISGNANGVFMTRGVMGQSIYVDPTAEMVIVRFASTPVWSNNFNDPTTTPAFAAMADHLMKAK